MPDEIVIDVPDVTEVVVEDDVTELVISAAGSGGASTFIELDDTPGAFSAPLQLVRINAAGNMLEFVAPAAPVAPGGADTEVQFNGAGSFGGISPFTWDGTNLRFDHNSGTNFLRITRTNSGDFLTPNIQADDDQDSGIVVYSDGVFTNVGFTIDGVPIFSALSVGGSTQLFMGGTTLQAIFTTSMNMRATGAGPGISAGLPDGKVTLHHSVAGTSWAQIIGPAGGFPTMRWITTGNFGVALIGPAVAAQIDFTLPPTIGAVRSMMTDLAGNGVLTMEQIPPRMIEFRFGTVTSGDKRRASIPFSGTILSVKVVADLSGSVAFDVFKDDFATYTGSAGMTDIVGAGDAVDLSTAVKNDVDVSGWTDVAVAADDIIELRATSTSITLTDVSVMIEIQPT